MAAIALVCAIAPGRAHAALDVRIQATGEPLVIETGTSNTLIVNIVASGVTCPDGSACEIDVILPPPSAPAGFTACWVGAPGCGSLTVPVDISGGFGQDAAALQIDASLVNRGELVVQAIGANPDAVLIAAIDPICDPITVAAFAGQSTTVSLPVVLPSDADLGVHFVASAGSGITAVAPADPTPDVTAVAVTVAGGAVGTRVDTLLAEIGGAQLECPITVHTVAPFDVILDPALTGIHVGLPMFVPFSIQRAPGFTGPISLSTLLIRAPAGTSASIFAKNSTVLLQVPFNAPVNDRFSVRVIGTAGTFTDSATKPFITQP